MKTKLLIAIVSIISVVSVATVADNYTNKELNDETTKNIYVCDIFSNWDEEVS